MISIEEKRRLERQLAGLKGEHRYLDAEVARLQSEAVPDQLGIRRLKKRKLQLKDEIQWIENRLIPDLDA